MTLSVALKISAISIIVFSIISCQKDSNNPTSVPNPIDTTATISKIDSSQLIKSLTYIYDNGVIAGLDSIRETFNYDTLARKIEITYASTDLVYITGLKLVFTYNADTLLQSIESIYPSSIPQNNRYFGSSFFTYDKDKVITKINSAYPDQSRDTTDFAKESTPQGGNIILWHLGQDADNATRGVELNSAGFPIRQFTLTQYDDGTLHSFADVDSIVNSASGEIEKIYSKEEGDDPSPYKLIYEFGARTGKGNQLSNLRKKLFKGITNIPFGDDDDGVISNFPVLGNILEYEYAQYSNTPITSAKVTGFDNENFTWTGDNRIDEKGRLTYFKAFARDQGLVPSPIQIVYYK